MVAALVLIVPVRSAAERLVVRTFDNSLVARDEMVIAQAAAGEILQEADLTVEWRDCSSGCAGTLGRREVLLRVVTAPTGAVAGSLGYSVVDVEAGSGSLATVYADRISSAARRTGVGVGKLLGRTVAHEIGHLLLGTSRHAGSGLMRARWSDRELERDHAADWILTPDVVAQLTRTPGGLRGGRARR
jgi:hypothetical protein